MDRQTNGQTDTKNYIGFLSEAEVTASLFVCVVTAAVLLVDC